LIDFIAWGSGVKELHLAVADLFRK
jgi:hypothetical protein